MEKDYGCYFMLGPIPTTGKCVCVCADKIILSEVLECLLHTCITACEVGHQSLPELEVGL